MTMKPNRKSAARVFLTLAVSLTTIYSASAQTATTGVVGNLPTCDTMLTNCINFANRAIMAAGPDGTIPSNISQNACYDMHRKAEKTGTWPQNLPFGFAEACTTDTEKHSGHLRHHHFGSANWRNNVTAVEDPAVTPTTPPIASSPTPTPTPTSN
jgi:hypothetical protein